MGRELLVRQAQLFHAVLGLRCRDGLEYDVPLSRCIDADDGIVPVFVGMPVGSFRPEHGMQVQDRVPVESQRFSFRMDQVEGIPVAGDLLLRMIVRGPSAHDNVSDALVRRHYTLDLVGVLHRGKFGDAFHPGIVLGILRAAYALERAYPGDIGQHLRNVLRYVAQYLRIVESVHDDRLFRYYLIIST